MHLRSRFGGLALEHPTGSLAELPEEFLVGLPARSLAEPLAEPPVEPLMELLWSFLLI